MARERSCLDGVAFGSFVVVCERAPKGRQRVFVVRCTRCGCEKPMTYSDVRRAQRATRANACRGCGSLRDGGKLSFDYRTDCGLMIQDFLCGRGRFRAMRSNAP